jgi:hypothetical protein
MTKTRLKQKVQILKSQSNSKMLKLAIADRLKEKPSRLPSTEQTLPPSKVLQGQLNQQQHTEIESSFQIKYLSLSTGSIAPNAISSRLANSYLKSTNTMQITFYRKTIVEFV